MNFWDITGINSIYFKSMIIWIIYTNNFTTREKLSNEEIHIRLSIANFTAEFSLNYMELIGLGLPLFLEFFSREIMLFIILSTSQITYDL